MMLKTSRRNILFLVFTFSGFSGLIYESVWTHYLKLFLGHAAYAQTLVLAIFMGGLSVGSWLCSRYSERWKDPLSGYALAEGVIGVFALLYHPAFDYATQLAYYVIIPKLGSPVAISIFKWSLSALLILPQSILLGMTFPLMSSALVREFPHTPGRSIAMLYFTNSIGACIGVLVSGFLLIRAVGLPGTMVLAGLINIALAVVVRFMSREERPVYRNEFVSEGPPGTTGSVLKPRYLLMASLVTGTASFIYEIGWIRMLSLVLGSSTHAFELMLSAFILGLAFGGLFIKRRIDDADPVFLLAIVQISMGLLAVCTMPIYEHSFGVMQWLLLNLNKTASGYMLFNLSSNFIAMAVMLPATFCAGMTLPLITCALIKQGHGERSIGAVYAMNTLGAIVGVFFAVHAGMPFLGLKGLITVGASMDIALGLGIFWGIRTMYTGKRVPVAAAVFGLCMILSALFFTKLDPYKMASGVYRFGRLLNPGNTRLVFHEDGKTSTVSVTLQNDTIMCIRTNGKADAAINMDTSREVVTDEATMIFAAALSAAYHPQAKTAANIGFGSGLTTHTLLCNPRLAGVDTVEIEKKIFEAAKHFRPRVELAYTDQRSQVYIEDAKTFFSSSNKKYDVIISEPSNPWVSGVAGLFSNEFYKLVGRHLSEDGLFVQWFQIYEIDTGLIASVFKALSANFSDFVVYAPNLDDLIIVAKKKGVLSDMDPSVFASPLMARELSRVHVNSLQDLYTRRVGNKKILGPFFDTFPIKANSDYYPVLDQNAARTRFMGTNASDILSIGTEPLPIIEMLSGANAYNDHTDVTLSTLYPKTKSVHTAMALRDYYLHGRFLPQYGELSPDTGEYALQLRRIFYEYSAKPDPNRRVFLFNTAKKMFPYLSPGESALVWKKIEAGPFAGSLSTIERAYVDLFKAIGSRDGGKMASTAKLLLDSEQDITPARMQYVVASGMLGYLAQGNRVEAARLWDAYRPRVAVKGKPSFVFRFLEAESFIH